MPYEATCQSCGKVFMIDEAHPAAVCPTCQGESVRSGLPPLVNNDTAVKSGEPPRRGGGGLGEVAWTVAKGLAIVTVATLAVIIIVFLGCLVAGRSSNNHW
jgi:hypothetical protein